MKKELILRRSRSDRIEGRTALIQGCRLSLEHDLGKALNFWLGKQLAMLVIPRRPGCERNP
jgi:hypothetical protein